MNRSASWCCWRGVRETCDRPCAGEFFGGGALETGESIHRDDLSAPTPNIGLGGQRGFEDLFRAARDHV